jgi:hypothetical protein
MGVQPTTLQAGLVRANASTDRTAPVSRVGAGGARQVEGGAFEVSGTASDIGGVVAGVEVSVDGGTTWHPADGTTAWRYRWTTVAPPPAGSVLSRAVDDSGNLERRAP